MKRKQQWIDAYRDGELSERKRRKVEAWLAEDAESASWLEQSDAVSKAVRKSFQDIPRAPSPEYLIASLRPEMARIDAERAEQTPEPSWLNWLRPAPMGALAAGCAAVIALVAIQLDLTAPGQTIARAEILPAFPATIYDLDSGESPLMVFEGEDGATIIWTLEEDEENVQRARGRSEGLA